MLAAAARLPRILVLTLPHLCAQHLPGHSAALFCMSHAQVLAVMPVAAVEEGSTARTSHATSQGLGAYLALGNDHLECALASIMS